MARVETGCRDCKRCTNSGAAELGRKAGRATAAVLSGGFVPLAGAFTKNCRGCGHKMSLHHREQQLAPVAPTPVFAAQPLPTAQPDPAMPNTAQRLAQLDALFAQGLVSQIEHQAQRSAILREL